MQSERQTSPEAPSPVEGVNDPEEIYRFESLALVWEFAEEAVTAVESHFQGQPGGKPYGSPRENLFVGMKTIMALKEQRRIS